MRDCVVARHQHQQRQPFTSLDLDLLDQTLREPCHSCMPALWHTHAPLLGVTQEGDLGNGIWALPTTMQARQELRGRLCDSMTVATFTSKLRTPL